MTKLISEFLNKMGIDEGSLPLRQIQIVKDYFGYAYCAGFDKGRILCAPKRKVSQYINGELIFTFDSMTEAARSMGVDHTTISKCIIQDRPDKKGNVWKLLTN